MSVETTPYEGESRDERITADLGVAMATIIIGRLLLRAPKLRFMAWPAFGVAGMIVGVQMKNDAIIQAAVAFSALTIVGQIVYDGWKRGR